VVLLEAGKCVGSGSVFEILAGKGAEKPIGAVMEAIVGENRDGLTSLLFDGGRLWVTDAAEAGKRVRVKIGADEILIAREAPAAISANNILPVVVSDITLTGARAEVGMRCGNARLVARITAVSAKRLDLSPGCSAFAVIKTVTIEGSK
jgi:molybdate transport system ATP-binding protein